MHGRVIYFVGACILSTVLTYVMKWGKAEPFGQALMCLAGIAIFSVVPLSDSLDRARFGPLFVRVTAVCAAVYKGCPRWISVSDSHGCDVHDSACATIAGFNNWID